MQIAIVVFDGVDELDALAPYEVLRAAKLDTSLVAVGAPRTVEGGHGLRFEAPSPIPARCDWLIVPGGGWASGAPRGVRAEIASGALAKEILRLRQEGTKLASVCTGAMLLSAAGILRGRRCATHAVAKHALAEEGGIVIDARVVDDGDVVTAGGVTSGLDLALHLITRTLGPEAMLTGARRLEHDPRGPLWITKP